MTAGNDNRNSHNKNNEDDNNNQLLLIHGAVFVSSIQIVLIFSPFIKYDI